MPTFEVPYRDAFNQGMARPYLVVHVRGPNGSSGDIIGTVDSGADTTSLPYEYATLMGYEAGDLEESTGQQVGGTMTIWRAKKPAIAHVTGLPRPEFELYPLFVRGSQMPLWGRSDFFCAFAVAFYESEQRFTLGLPD